MGNVNIFDSNSEKKKSRINANKVVFLMSTSNSMTSMTSINFKNGKKKFSYDVLKELGTNRK